MNCEAENICLAAAAVLLIAIVFTVGFAAGQRSRRTEVLFGKRRTGIMTCHKIVMNAVRRLVRRGIPRSVPGESRPEVPGQETTPKQNAPLRCNIGSPENVLDTIFPLNNNDGSAYGFKFSLSDGGTVAAVIHSEKKDDLLQYPDLPHYHYTLMQYDAGGELVDVRAAPVSGKQA